MQEIRIESLEEYIGFLIKPRSEEVKVWFPDEIFQECMAWQLALSNGTAHTFFESAEEIGPLQFSTYISSANEEGIGGRELGDSFEIEGKEST